jgi:hypothetical protein
MAGINYISFFMLGLLLACIFCLSDAARINIQDQPVVPHNATLHRRNNINKYGGCDKVYAAGKGKDLVKQAYKDTLRIAQYINPFLVTPEGIGGPTILPPRTLELRFFGNFSANQEIRDQISSAATSPLLSHLQAHLSGVQYLMSRAYLLPREEA